MEATISLSVSRSHDETYLFDTTVIVARAVLHNMALIFNDVLPEDDDEPVIEEEVPIDQPRWQPRDGFAAREALIDRLFN